MCNFFLKEEEVDVEVFFSIFITYNLHRKKKYNHQVLKMGVPGNKTNMITKSD